MPRLILAAAAILLLTDRDAAAQPRTEGFVAIGLPSRFGTMLAAGGDRPVAGPLRAGGEGGWSTPHALHAMPYGKLALGQGPNSRVTAFAIGGWVLAAAPKYDELYHGVTYGVGVNLRNDPRKAAFRIEYVRMHLGRGRHTEFWNLVRLGVAFR